MSDERLYTFEQAKILGKRAICDESDRGHSLSFTRQTSWNGKVIVSTVYCDKCDVRVTFSYPDLPDA